jgi:nickel-dependent lactate racemase
MKFAFGKAGIDVSIPDGYECSAVENKAVRPVSDVGVALANALDHPFNSPSLTESAAGKKRVAIVVCDITRPARNSVTLPLILERLHRAGVQKDGITILIATGLHRVATAEEVKQIVGVDIAQNYRIISNDAKAEGQHRNLGTTSRGTPVLIHNEFVQADLRITLGFIEQHFIAGFSGGRKLVAPGVAAEKTIKAIHSPKFMRDVRACEGSVLDTLHAELLEIAQIARHDFMVDATLTRDRQISGAFAGDPVVAHAEGVRFLEDASLICTDDPADLVVTSAAGFPLDLTFYQMINAITAAQQLVKAGGRILVISECAEGVGSLEFAATLGGMQSFEQFLDETASAPVKVDQWQLEKLAQTGMRNQIIYFVPGVGEHELGFLGASAHRTLDRALEAATAGLQVGAKVYLVADGPYTFARSLKREKSLASSPDQSWSQTPATANHASN